MGELIEVDFTGNAGEVIDFPRIPASPAESTEQRVYEVYRVGKDLIKEHPFIVGAIGGFVVGSLLQRSSS